MGTRFFVGAFYVLSITFVMLPAILSFLTDGTRLQIAWRWLIELRWQLTIIQGITILWLLLKIRATQHAGHVVSGDDLNDLWLIGKLVAFGTLALFFLLVEINTRLYRHSGRTRYEGIDIHNLRLFLFRLISKPFTCLIHRTPPST